MERENKGLFDEEESTDAKIKVDKEKTTKEVYPDLLDAMTKNKDAIKTSKMKKHINENWRYTKMNRRKKKR